MEMRHKAAMELGKSAQGQASVLLDHALNEQPIDSIPPSVVESRDDLTRESVALGACQLGKQLAAHRLRESNRVG